jgi:methylmalonyl-CoA/ethylmalonyl-CoA epimerase
MIRIITGGDDLSPQPQPTLASNDGNPQLRNPQLSTRSPLSPPTTATRNFATRNPQLLTRNSTTMRLDHIGIAVPNLDESEKLIARLLGRKAYKRETVEKQHVTTSFFRAGADAGAGEAIGAKLEFVAPEGAEGPIHKYLEKRGPGLHHLAFEVDDIRAEMARLAADGFQLLSEEPSLGADNKLVCFLHPKSTGGVLVEICQSIKA